MAPNDRPITVKLWRVARNAIAVMPPAHVGHPPGRHKHSLGMLIRNQGAWRPECGECRVDYKRPGQDVKRQGRSSRTGETTTVSVFDAAGPSADLMKDVP